MAVSVKFTHKELAALEAEAARRVQAAQGPDFIECPVCEGTGCWDEDGNPISQDEDWTYVCDGCAGVGRVRKPA